MTGAVVVGAGVVTPLGVGLDATWSGLVAGRGAVAPITRFDASEFPVRIGAEGPDPERVASDPVALGRSWVAACLAEALDAVDLDRVAPSRIGVFVGAEAVRPALGDVAGAMLRGRILDRERAEAHAPWAMARWVADRVGARGPVATLSTACTSSAQAVGEALLALRRGEVDLALAIGADVLVDPLMVTGFARLGALSTRNDDPARASRPFDVDRDGFVLGEGAGALAMVRPDRAAELGSSLGRVTGYGASCNAWRITDSPADGRGAWGAIVEALRDAGRRPDEVALIHAHGTATRQNDASEAVGIRRALGDRTDAVPVFSSKGAIGHLVAACGVVGVALALRALNDRVAPPTLNLERLDPACPIRASGGGTAPLEHGVALCNAFGFGGANATLVVEAP